MLADRLSQRWIAFYEGTLKRRHTFHYWRELERSQWLSRDAIDRPQLDALRRLVEHAAVHCPYYRDLWLERGLKASELSCLAEFEAWPLVDRETVRRNRIAMRSTSPGTKLLSKATGGSSGVPLQFDFTPESNDRRMAAAHRGYAWAGAGPGTKQLYLWGAPMGDRPTRLAPLERFCL